MKALQISMEKVAELRRQEKSWEKISLLAGVSATHLRKHVRLSHDFPAELRRGMNSPSGVTTEELEEMVKVERMTDQDIADRLGLRSAEAAGKMRNRHGIYRREKDSSRNSIPQEELDWAEKLLDEGNSYSGVQEITHVGYKALKKHFPGRGFTKEQSIEAAIMGRKLSEISVIAA